MLTAGEYEDGIPGNSTYSEGDWDGDGDFTSNDLVFVFQAGTYSAAVSPNSVIGAALLAFDDERFDEPAKDVIETAASAVAKRREVEPLASAMVESVFGEVPIVDQAYVEFATDDAVDLFGQP